jgi:hypothetical protein
VRVPVQAIPEAYLGSTILNPDPDEASASHASPTGLRGPQHKYGGPQTGPMEAKQLPQVKGSSTCHA